MAEINNTGTGQWSESDAGNTSPPPDGAPAGTFPNQAEGIWRAMMGALKRFWDRINGTVTTTGSAGAYVYTPANASFPTVYVTGEAYAWRSNFTSAGNDTLNVNALGAKPIYKPGSSGMARIAAGDIQNGQMVLTAYDANLASGGGGFHLLSPVANLASGNVSGPASSTAGDVPKFADATGKLLADGYAVGTAANDLVQLDASARLPAVDGSQLTNITATGTGKFMFASSSYTEPGWVRANGLTLGDASSSATERANADTANLFSFLWAQYANAQLPVSGGRGASAVADFAAHKTITLPDMRGRGAFGLDDSGNSAASRITATTASPNGTTSGATGGAQTFTLATANLASHSHAAQAGFFAETGIPGASSDLSGACSSTHSSAASTTANAGSGTAFDKTPPFFLGLWMIKL